MHPEMYLLLHHQREQELLTNLRHRQLAQSRPTQQMVPGVAARAVARVRRVLVARDSRSAPVECCPAA